LECFIPDPGKHQLWLGENFAHCPSWIFSFPVRKSVPRPEEVQKSGVGNEISHPHSTILEKSWKFSEIPEISTKFSGSPKIAWTLAKDLYNGPLSNRFIKIVNHTTNLYNFFSTGFPYNDATI
jgi:hypothetical protein